MPTVAEQGYPSFSFSGWYGVIVPRGVPPSIMTKLNAELNCALQSPDVKQRIEFGGEVGGGTAADFEAQVERDITTYRALLPASSSPTKE